MRSVVMGYPIWIYHNRILSQISKYDISWTKTLVWNCPDVNFVVYFLALNDKYILLSVYRKDGRFDGYYISLGVYRQHRRING